MPCNRTSSCACSVKVRSGCSGEKGCHLSIKFRVDAPPFNLQSDEVAPSPPQVAWHGANENKRGARPSKRRPDLPGWSAVEYRQGLGNLAPQNGLYRNNGLWVLISAQRFFPNPRTEVNAPNHHSADQRHERDRDQ